MASWLLQIGGLWRSERPIRRGTATWAPADPRAGDRGVMDAIISLRTATLAIVCTSRSRSGGIATHLSIPLRFLRFEASRGDLRAVLHWRA